MTQQSSTDATAEVLLVAVYDDEAKAQQAIEQLRDKMARLVFQSRPKQLHLANVSQPGHQAIFRDVHE
jgi:hypothetical protein